MVTGDLLHQALRNAHRLSLITYDPSAESRTIRIHALTQRATLDTLTPGERGQLILTAADAVFDVWPEVENDRALSGVLCANAAALIAHDTDGALWTGRGHPHPVLARRASSLGHAGALAAAVHASRGLIQAALSWLDPDDPNTLALRANLAHWTGRAGGVADAIAVF